MAVWARTADGLSLRVRLQPRSSRNRVVGVLGDSVKIQVNAPPVDGAANEAMLETVARWLDVPRRTVTLAHGNSGRNKVVRITTQTPDRLVECVEALQLME